MLGSSQAGYLREGNPSRGNSRRKCPERGACRASDHLPLWPPGGEEGAGWSNFTIQLFFSHTSISNLYLINVHVRSRKDTYKETDALLCALSLVLQRRECGPAFGDYTITTKHTTLRFKALEGQELSGTSMCRLISDDAKILWRNIN